MKKTILDITNDFNSKVKALTEEYNKQIKELEVVRKRPAEGELYYFIVGDVKISNTLFVRAASGDCQRFEVGNYFLSVEEAEAKVEWLKAVERVKVWIADN